MPGGIEKLHCRRPASSYLQLLRIIPAGDRMRLTGRGLDGHGESFETHTTADAIAIRYR